MKPRILLKPEQLFSVFRKCLSTSVELRRGDALLQNLSYYKKFGAFGCDSSKGKVFQNSWCQFQRQRRLHYYFFQQQLHKDFRSATTTTRYYCKENSKEETSGENPALNDFIKKAEGCSGEDSVVVMKVLNVAEKNDAAKRIANLLGNGAVQTRNSYSVYNKLYEFEYNFRGQRTQMTMTSVSGHLLNYEFDAAHRKWNSCDPVELFDAPVMKQCNQNMKEILRTLEGQAPYFQVLIIWTDCDREGENIGYEVINVCKRINPRLQVLRAKFSEITKQSVVNAMNNLVPPDKRVSDAVDVRQELDLRIGAAFTRFQTLRLTRKFPAYLTDRLISYGSCQFPTLGFVVERYKAILDFVAEDFWKIDVTHKVDELNVNFNWARVRLFDQLAVQSIFEACLDNPMARVVRVQSKPKNKWRPVALDTIEFEKLASRKLRIGAKQAMAIAEKLYTAGIISYPRTETNIFPQSLNLTSLIEEQTGDNQWGGFATRLLQRGGPDPRNGKKSDQAHPPIHPIKHVTNLAGDEKKVYDLVVRHFLACCSKDAVGKETNVDIEISGEKFVANGLTVIERNYLEVYIYDKWSDKEIPDFALGETFRPTKIEMNEGRTSAPPLLTEADLIALMEKHGIGTDATHAEHIETIKARQYVGLQGIHFMPGKLGMGLVDGYDSMGFEMSKPHLRAQLESDLQKICQGTKRPEVVLREQVQSYKQVFIQACDQVVRLDDALAKVLIEGSGNTGGGGGGGNAGGGPRGRGNAPAINRRGNDDDDDDDEDGGYGGSGTNSSVGRGRGRGNSACSSSTSSRANTRPPTSSISTSRNNFSSSTSNNSIPSSSSRPAVNQTRTTNVTEDEGVHCHCGDVPVIRTVRKEGQNCGRQFYKCDICGFFQWADENASSRNTQRNNSGYGTQSSTSTSSAMGAPRPPNSQYTRPNNSGNTQRYNNHPNQSINQSRDPGHEENEGGSRIPSCNCSKPAASYTVRKDGPNKGRKFFGCSVPYQSNENRCDFFQWDDEGVGGAATNNNTTQSRIVGTKPKGSFTGIGSARKGRGGGQGGVKRARRCGICHQEGHTRRNCPLSGGDEDDYEDME